jgi:DNA-binding response OmpR family regulator
VKGAVPQRILIVEDDAIFRSLVRDNLVFEGYQVEAIGTGNAALTRARGFAPDLVLLDMALPDIDGLDLCPLLRRGGKVAIIILSVRGQKSDRMAGLKLGADDYITKPIDLDELLARIRAVLRRAHPTVQRVIVGRLLIDFRTQRATCGDQPVRLTHREFELLRYLAERHDRVVHRDELLREVWGYLIDTTMTRTVDQAIARLRKKIEPNPHHPEFLRTAHRDGYCLSAVEEA